MSLTLFLGIQFLHGLVERMSHGFGFRFLLLLFASSLFPSRNHLAGNGQGPTPFIAGVVVVVVVVVLGQRPELSIE